MKKSFFTTILDKRHRKQLLTCIMIAVLIIAILATVILLKKKTTKKQNESQKTEVAEPTLSPEEIEQKKRQLLIADADLLAAGYDYDGAVALIDSYENADNYAELVEAKQKFEAEKTTLVAQDIQQIPHIFFHSLIADPAKAFDGDNESDGYNQYMTTIDEFNKIMQQMYDRGYVLVSIHDMAYEVQNPDGSVSFQKGSILLPENKKAFVMSVDDVNYYNYMLQDGFASRIIIGEDGKPTNEMDLEDGTTVQGAFDVVPLLDQFIEGHPDFSYKGARGILAITGYEGVLGYRTCPTDDRNGYNESDIEKAKLVAEALKADGWEFASHSWGHKHMGQMSLEAFKVDTDRWKAEVEPILGETDILIYPYGNDIADFRGYSQNNEKFQYFKNAGFSYFCNVDANTSWVQMGSNYLRQGRRNLDGYRMYYDMIDDSVDKLSDLFDVNEVFDPVRPTPIKSMTGSGK